MAVIDAFFSNVIWKSLYFAIACLVGFKLRSSIAYVIKNFFSFGYMFFLNRCSKPLRKDEQSNNLKTKLFEPLDNQKTKLGRSLEILEIGIGCGENFIYFPRDSKITALEPNPYADSYIKNGISGHNVSLKRIVHGHTQNMLEIEDESFDAVVATEVFCHFLTNEEVKKALDEIHRVLKPNGVLYIKQHIVGKKGSWTRLIQTIWSKVSVHTIGCTGILDPLPIFNQSSFVDIDMENIDVKLFPWFLRPHLIGTMKKPN